MSRSLVPMAGLGVVLGTALLLILLVTLRPWGGADSSWNTHLNFREGVPTDYSRTDVAWLDTEPALPAIWSRADSATGGLPSAADGYSEEPLQGDAAVDNAGNEEDGFAIYVGRGCVSCHGLDGTGGAVGPDLTEATASELRREARNGPDGMPEYLEADLSDEEAEAIYEFLQQLQVAEEPPQAETPPDGPSAEPTPTPVAQPTPTPRATPSPTPTPPASTETSSTPLPTPPAGAEPSPTPPAAPEGVAFEAAVATLTVDGDSSDWAGISGAQVTLQQIIPIPGKDMGEVASIDVTLKVAVDSSNIYVLMEVPDDYDYVADDRGLSAAMAVMFRIDDPAAPHMGAEEEEQKKSLGMVDIWYWNLDCGPGQMSGGNVGASGNDPDCNFDDEYSTTPKDREDDDSVDAENSLAGVWEHTARAQGPGAEGTWIFEMSRPLQTGDPGDAQLELGGEAHMALAYWDADETPDGWTDLGHLQSATGGWIEVALPAITP